MVRSSLDAPIIDGDVEYVGRPGLSPVVATLVAAGLLRREHRVLDVGCGRGNDLLALARLGFRRLTGIDHNRRSIAAARRRKGAEHVEFRLDTLAALLTMPPRSYDWVIDTFLVNNLDERETPRYLERLARVLPPGGGLALQHKCGPESPEARGEGGVRSPYFDFGTPAVTWFAEYDGRAAKGRRAKTGVPGFVQVGRRNNRAVPKRP